MAKIKFHIASQTELVLDQAAQVGDMIDLALLRKKELYE